MSRPACRVKKRSPSYDSLMGMMRRMTLSARLRDGSTSGSSSPLRSIFTLVSRRIAPKTYIVQVKSLSSASPPAMQAPRMSTAPRIPQKSTRGWLSRETLKRSKISAKTNTLSIDSDCSTR